MTRLCRTCQRSLHWMTAKHRHPDCNRCRNNAKSKARQIVQMQIGQHIGHVAASYIVRAL
jgi:hypothetical protein